MSQSLNEEQKKDIQIYKETLQKQLQLLSEHSKKVSEYELAELSKAMVDIVRTLLNRD